MKKTHKVVMLSTEKASQIYKKGQELQYYRLPQQGVSELGGQHLYIISDDEIKESDWVYDSSSLPQDAPIKRIRIIDDTHYTLYGDTSRNLKHHYKKIVATTDKLASGKCMEERCLLHPCDGKCCIPQIPESFIQAFIKAYNDNKPITEVDLEIEELSPMEEMLQNEKYVPNNTFTSKIKTRPDNTVIVHQSKMYSRDEVVKLFHACRIARMSNSEPSMNEWIQDNL